MSNKPGTSPDTYSSGSPGRGSFGPPGRGLPYVLAADYRIDDMARLLTTVGHNRDQVFELGVRHLAIYQSLRDPNRVLVTMGIMDRKPLDTLLRSPAVFSWFDSVGVEEIPPLFAGELMEEIDLVDDEVFTDPPGGILVAAVAPIRDLDSLLVNVHDRHRRLTAAGVRKVWIYRAIDDGHEAMVLQELDTIGHAQHWIDRPDSVAEWMRGNGGGVYPPIFVGSARHVLSFGKPK
ncbi:fatty-acid--CoA ligase [Aldersonia sp. NBC_00410]|uniref:fatty-acid--CoA ligase n=1 Tax=Aldersonia sp. NBC_00410 TaxID=2975954 RepID=UPI00224E76E0|nr:fatty-acid--CoA ligase [Aldersonia sp. NBC_00410]MCX5044618.1 fatty-acid--CoA ligase [Aldersonia sp. NBC_00410]